MARTTVDQTLTRRARVEELDLCGTSPAVIARELHSDARTIRRDLAAIAKDRAASTDLAGERHRLLAAARAVEREAWTLYRTLPGDDAAGKLGALTRVLQSHARAAAICGALEQGGLAAELADLREQVAALTTALPVRGLRTVGGMASGAGGGGG